MSVCNGILSVFLSKVRNLTSRSFSQYVECVLKPNTLQTVSCIFTIHYRLGHLVATLTGRRVCVDIEICMYIECNNSHVGYTYMQKFEHGGRCSENTNGDPFSSDLRCVMYF